ncbi:hypothetical protein FZ929_07720 [Klebsiella pneumoniae]|uniref:MukB N-terminal domain-containing protein n=2 Tax=Klebsiella pneumoniae TaxID=573 RepID=A0A5C2LHG9_KLEPN|nr:hypothetical protein FZ929_07720 [Klebsiella pneumoniae]
MMRMKKTSRIAGGRVMIERGKFRSLTLVNWNGFFARTFDLDELVTTLSGERRG